MYVDKAKEMTQERGHIEGLSDADKNTLFQLIGMGGLKYYLLKVDPKKRILFDPKESKNILYSKNNIFNLKVFVPNGPNNTITFKFSE